MPAIEDLSRLQLRTHPCLPCTLIPLPYLPLQTFTMMIISRWVFDKFGWGMAALITPTVLLITGEAQQCACAAGGAVRTCGNALPAWLARAAAVGMLTPAW